MKIKNSNIQHSTFNIQRGVSLYLAVLIMAIFLSIGLTISTILIGQISTIKGMGDSVIAFYAADTGIEKVLLNRANPPSIPIPGTLENDSSYVVTVISPGSDCTADNYCIRSVGTYRGIKRAIEVEY